MMKNCHECGLSFHTEFRRAKYCCESCKVNAEKRRQGDTEVDRNRKANESWLKRDYEKHKEGIKLRNRKNNNMSRLEFGATQDDQVNKRFQACRG